MRQFTRSRVTRSASGGEQLPPVSNRPYASSSSPFDSADKACPEPIFHRPAGNGTGKTTGGDRSGLPRVDTAARATRRPHQGASIRGQSCELILDRVNGARWWPRRPRLENLRRQPEVSQDSLHHRRVFNPRHEAEPPSTPSGPQPHPSFIDVFDPAALGRSQGEGAGEGG